MNLISTGMIQLRIKMGGDGKYGPDMYKSNELIAIVLIYCIKPLSCPHW